MRFTLRQIEVFLAVARNESVSQAAQRLALSQSATSGALGDLESQFEVQLFERHGKRLRLSSLGRAVRAQAQALLDQADALQSALAGGDSFGHLRIGATLTIGNHLAGPLMASFLERHPEAELSLTLANTTSVARQVANFELDVGLIEGDVQHPELHLLPWRDDELVVFCAPDHPMAHGRPLSRRELRAAKWILREEGSGTRQAFDRAMAGLLSELHVTLTLEHNEAIKGAVKAGLGVGCLSRIALQEAFEHGTLVPCELPGRSLRRRFAFLLHKQKHMGSSIKAWLAHCRKSEKA